MMNAARGAIILLGPGFGTRATEDGSLGAGQRGPLFYPPRKVNPILRYPHAQLDIRRHRGAVRRV